MVPFCPFHGRVSILKPNSRKKRALIVKGLLRNLEVKGLGFGGVWNNLLRRVSTPNPAATKEVGYVSPASVEQHLKYLSTHQCY